MSVAKDLTITECAIFPSGDSYSDEPPLESYVHLRLWSQQLELCLGVEQKNLRFYNAEGELVPTPAEIAHLEMQRFEQKNNAAIAWRRSCEN